MNYQTGENTVAEAVKEMLPDIDVFTDSGGEEKEPPAVVVKFKGADFETQAHGVSPRAAKSSARVEVSEFGVVIAHKQSAEVAKMVDTLKTGLIDKLNGDTADDSRAYWWLERVEPMEWDAKEKAPVKIVDFVIQAEDLLYAGNK